MIGPLRQGEDGEPQADERAAEGALGHRFGRPDLLRQALTHRSAGAWNNERLEFLGDAVIGFVVAEELFRARPAGSEGELTRLRARLVRKETLAAAARQARLGRCLHLGGSALKSGGRDLDSVLADAVEAVIGAVYLDAGLEAARAALLRLIADPLDAIPREEGAKDPKTALQEYLQGRGELLPGYEVVAVTGAAHARRYTVRCVVGGLGQPTLGHGSSRRRAEQQAAAAALRHIGLSDG